MYKFVCKGGENMIYVIGLGPGGEDQMTPRALAALERCDVIIGYKTYIDLIEPLFRGKCELVVSPMRGEVWTSPAVMTTRSPCFTRPCLRA